MGHDGKFKYTFKYTYNWSLRRGRENREVVFKEIMTKNIPAMRRHQAKDSRSATKSKQDKYEENLT